MTSGLIIAAGYGNKGEALEPLRKLGSISALQYIVSIFRRAGIDRIVTVYNNDKDEKPTTHMNVAYLYSENNSSILDNVKLGLSYLRDKCAHTLIAPVNVPLFSLETVNAVMGFNDSICIPFCDGIEGYPIGVDTGHFDDILKCEGIGGFAHVLDKAGLAYNPIGVTDEGIFTDVCDEVKINNLIGRHSIKKQYFDARIRFLKETPFYGPGAHQLLQLTEELGSLYEACVFMCMSYSKGRKIISVIEQQLGYPVIDSFHGGKDGGYSVLTEGGKQLMADYGKFCDEANLLLHQLYIKHFPD